MTLPNLLTSAQESAEVEELETIVLEDTSTALLLEVATMVVSVPVVKFDFRHTLVQGSLFPDWQSQIENFGTQFFRQAIHMNRWEFVEGHVKRFLAHTVEAEVDEVAWPPPMQGTGGIGSGCSWTAIQRFRVLDWRGVLFILK